MANRPVVEATKTDQIVYASLLLVVLNSCPFIFVAVLIKNRKNLGEKKTQVKFGSLITSLNAKNPAIISYSLVFLARRSLFAVITFTLLNKPAVQL